MKRLTIALIALGIMVFACDRSNLADINQDPATVNEPDLLFLFTQSLEQMERNPYTQWFYDNVQYMLPWTQMTVGQGGGAIPQGNESQLNQFQASGDRISKWYEDVMPPLFEIRHYIDEELSGNEQAGYQKLRALTYPVQIYYGLRVTDLYGARPYSQALQARYTNPPMLTPEFDTQQELYNTWLEELNGALETLASDPQYEGETVNQISLGEQDFVYGGNWEKWAKFINSLKLRIAVRLLHQDPQRALNIAETVASSTFGPILTMEDNFTWASSTQYYGPANPGIANNIEAGHGGRNLINFLRENRDPRLRFLYNKNDFNSMVVQGFFDAGKEDDIPAYIRAHIKSSEVDGRRVFEGWEAPGEPWVRYYGAPVAPDSARSGNVAEEYFRTQNWRLEDKTYEPKSLYKMEMYGTSIDFNYPDVPGQTSQNTQDYQYHNTLYSAAETNLYMAELKLLGANLPNSAQSYFQTGIRQSVETYDQLAQSNGILYYDEPYDTEYGAAVQLESGEIQQLMTKDAYTLNGASTQDELEKVYVQQLLHFIGKPTQLYVTALRSGVPRSDSRYLKREPFWDGGVEMVIPRRFGVNQPTQDNINYNNILEGLEAQGFSPGNTNPQTLHDERIWYDQGAPDWGEGPNY